MSGSDPDIKNVWQKLEQILRRGRGPVPAMDESASLWRQYSHDLCKDPLAMVGLAILVLLISIAVLAPYIAPYDPDAIEISRRLQWPNQDHLLGSDKLGRDVLSRIIFGCPALSAHARHNRSHISLYQNHCEPAVRIQRRTGG